MLRARTTKGTLSSPAWDTSRALATGAQRRVTSHTRPRCVWHHCNTPLCHHCDTYLITAWWHHCDTTVSAPSFSSSSSSSMQSTSANLSPCYPFLETLFFQSMWPRLFNHHKVDYWDFIHSFFSLPYKHYTDTMWRPHWNFIIHLKTMSRSITQRPQLHREHSIA
jgi:hypothetical protein